MCWKCRSCGRRWLPGQQKTTQMSSSLTCQTLSVPLSITFLLRYVLHVSNHCIGKHSQSHVVWAACIVLAPFSLFRHAVALRTYSFASSLYHQVFCL